MTLVEILGEMPDGRGATIDWQTATQWLAERYLAPECSASRSIERATRRRALYRDCGHKYAEELIDKVFNQPEVRKLRRDWVEVASGNNVTRRIVHELATLYQRPARRTVSGDEDMVRYQTALRLMRMDDRMRLVQRLAILQRSVLIRPTVPAHSKIPCLEIVDRHQFRPVAHPLNPERLVAVIIDQAADAPNMLANDDPARFLVWTESEWFRISGKGALVGEVQPHKYGRIPYVLAAIDPPPGELTDDTTFEDVISAHLAVWFENVLLLKESKSATKMPVAVGDLSSVARGQMHDSEGLIEMREGTSIGVHDNSMDLSMFRTTADHFLERAAANHGIPPAILHHAGATSGYEIELRHVGIRERRIEQEATFREVERELAELTSRVLQIDAPHLAFETEDWAIDFGDAQMPRSPKEALEIFEHARRVGLTNTTEEIQRRNPDLSEEAAWDVLATNIAVETRRNALMRPLASISGSSGADQPTDAESPVNVPADGRETTSPMVANPKPEQ